MHRNVLPSDPHLISTHSSHGISAFLDVLFSADDSHGLHHSLSGKRDKMHCILYWACSVSQCTAKTNQSWLMILLKSPRGGKTPSQASDHAWGLFSGHFPASLWVWLWGMSYLILCHRGVVFISVCHGTQDRSSDSRKTRNLQSQACFLSPVFLLLN